MPVIPRAGPSRDLARLLAATITGKLYALDRPINRFKGSTRQPLMTSSTKPLQIMIVAGEASGEQYGSRLVESIRALSGDREVKVFGAGGEMMRRAGVELLVDTRDLSVIGLVEILRRLGRFLRAREVLVRAAEERRPDVIILIDWPEFNFRLARKFRRKGLRIVYYVVPQVWAWRRWRARALVRDFKKLLVILPFERDYYLTRQIPVEFVGHPLLDVVHASCGRLEFIARYGLDPAKRTIAVLPGSRGREVGWNLPCLLDAIELLGHRKDLQFVLPLASSIGLDDLLEVARQNRKLYVQSLQSNSTGPFYRMTCGDHTVTIVVADTHNALAHSAMAVIASGTAALEAAILGTPAIVVYKTTPLNWEIFRPMVGVDRVSLINLIAKDDVVPELLQGDVSGERVAQNICELIDKPEKIERMRSGLRAVAGQLGCGGASQTAAKVILTLIASHADRESGSEGR